jgi:hypothetical protein
MNNEQSQFEPKQISFRVVNPTPNHPTQNVSISSESKALQTMMSLLSESKEDIESTDIENLKKIQKNFSRKINNALSIAGSFHISSLIRKINALQILETRLYSPEVLNRIVDIGQLSYLIKSIEISVNTSIQFLQYLNSSHFIHDTSLLDELNSASDKINGLKSISKDSRDKLITIVSTVKTILENKL